MNKHICKAKTIDTGEWVYGYYVAVPEEHSYGKEMCHAIFTTDNEHICMGEYNDHGWYEVDPETVCRCIGKKDKNGNLIFEYDVLLGHKYDTPMTVVWDHDSAQFIVEYEMGAYGLCTNTVHGVDSLEIVCNINDI